MCRVGGTKIERTRVRNIFLAVQDSSITDIVCLSVPWSQLTIRACNDFNDYNDYNDYYDYYNQNDYNDYRDSDINLDLDWERFCDLVI